jgi:hypothetical protein
VLLCGQHRQRPATPDRHEEEDRPLNDIPLLEQWDEPLELPDVVGAHRRVDLQRHALSPRVVDARHRPRKRALKASESIVD